MSGSYPSSLFRRIERQWVKKAKSLEKMFGKIAAVIERTSDRDGVLIPVPVRAVVNRRRLDRSQQRD
jgi:hypothetical protein